jgi:hypothetical protein
MRNGASSPTISMAPVLAITGSGGKSLDVAALLTCFQPVADHAFLHEAADALETLGSWAPGGCGLACLPGEAAVVVRDEFAQHGVGRGKVGGLGQAQFAAEAILQHTPKTLHTTTLCSGKAAASRSPSRPAASAGYALIGHWNRTTDGGKWHLGKAKPKSRKEGEITCRRRAR